jgi:hypothetical protein
MKRFDKHEILYLVNSVLLFIHEEDSAYWKEWELFGLPGGIQFFLLGDMILIATGLIGFRYVVLKQRAGMWFALLQAGCGILAFVLHGNMILTGHPEFTLPVSELVLVLSFGVSIVQAVVSSQELRKQRGGSHSDTGKGKRTPLSPGQSGER